MEDKSKARSSSIDLGATVVVKRDGELLGQRGSVVDKKQGWYKVQLPGVDGIKSFRWAEIKEMEAPPPSPLPSANPSPIKPQAPSPSKKNSSESTAAAAAAAAAVGVAGDKSSSRGKAAGGLPPRHPSTASAASAADEKTVAMRRRLTRGRPSENDAGVTPSSSAAEASDQPDQEREKEKEQEEEEARGASAGKTGDVDDDEETESEANCEVDEDETDLDDVEEGGGGGEDTDVGEGHEERAREEEEGHGEKKQEEEEEEEEEEDEEEEEEEEEEDVDIDAMVKLAAAAARKHNASSQARTSGGSATAAAASSGTGAANSGASGDSRVPSGKGVTTSQAARRRPRLSGVTPRTLDSGLASPKYLQYSGTAKGKSLTASVSSGVVDGGKAAKLMAGSSLYSGRDRAMLLERSKAPKDDTAGKGWFNMEQAEMTPELKRDLQVIRMRNYVDPKRFYKASDKVSKFMQIGTVKEGPSEYFSSRMTNKERKKTLVDELLVADDAFRAYSKNQYGSIQSRKRAGGKAAYNDQKRKRKGGMQWKP